MKYDHSCLPAISLCSLWPGGCNQARAPGVSCWTLILGATGSTRALYIPMQDMHGKVVLITGASTGIGRAAADRVAAAGAIVIGTSRWPWRYPQPPNWQLFQMDQTSDDSVKQLISRWGCFVSYWLTAACCKLLLLSEGMMAANMRQGAFLRNSLSMFIQWAPAW